MGSIWFTSSLENNQVKYLAKYTPTADKLHFEQVSINPYIFVEYETQTADLFGDNEDTKQVDLQQIQSQREKTQSDMLDNFRDQSVRKTEISHQEKVDLKTISLTVRTNDLDYNRMDEFVDPALRQQLQDVKLKKQASNMQDLIQ